MGSMRLGKDTTAASWWPLRGRRRELFLITAAMVPAIGELDLGDDLGMIEDRGILARSKAGRLPPSSSVVMAAPMQPAGEALCEQYPGLPASSPS
jgi:hypothetical protein